MLMKRRRGGGMMLVKVRIEPLCDYRFVNVYLYIRASRGGLTPLGGIASLAARRFAPLGAPRVRFACPETS